MGRVQVCAAVVDASGCHPQGAPLDATLGCTGGSEMSEILSEAEIEYLRVNRADRDLCDSHEALRELLSEALPWVERSAAWGAADRLATKLRSVLAAVPSEETTP
jgi:hypothetical protein